MPVSILKKMGIPLTHVAPVFRNTWGCHGISRVAKSRLARFGVMFCDADGVRLGENRPTELYVRQRDTHFKKCPDPWGSTITVGHLSDSTCAHSPFIENENS